MIIKSTVAGSSQHAGPILAPLNIRRHHIICNQKGPIMLRTTHIDGVTFLPFEMKMVLLHTGRVAGKEL